jgi:HSP20 family molecular chaperone IbpA
MNIATSVATLALAQSTLSNAFHVSPTDNVATGTTSTSLEARRMMLVPVVPTVRRRTRSSVLFPDIGRMFQEMDELMETSLSTTVRPSQSLLKLDRSTPNGLSLRRPFGLGMEVSQDEHEYKVSMNVQDAEAKDLNLQLDNDGRVLRLTGKRIHEDGGMKVQSRFEKALLLAPDADTTKLSASVAEGMLNISVPKIEKKENEVDTTKDSTKIDIQFEEPQASLADNETKNEVGYPVEEDDTPKAPTRLSIENMKNEKAEVKKSNKSEAVANEKKWPVRDFPY